MWTPFEDWAARLGHYAWFEQQLFGLLGQWSARSREPGACIVLARHGRHCAWHAELWDQLLPTVAGTDVTSLVQAPNDAVAALMSDLVADQSSPTATEDLLAAIYRVAGPVLASTYDDHRATASPVAEAPTIRVLDLVRQDQTVDLDEGRRLLDRLFGDAPGRSGSDLDDLRERWNSALPGGWKPAQLGAARARR